MVLDLVNTARTAASALLPLPPAILARRWATVSRTFLTVVFAVLFAVVGSGCRQEDPAQALYDEASQLAVQARRAEPESYEQAARLYEAAQDSLDGLDRLYPDSLVARQVRAGMLFPAGMTRERLSASAQNARGRALAGADPVACALRVINRLHAVFARAEALAELAEATHASGRKDEGLALMRAAEAAAMSVQDDDDRAQALVTVSGGWARLGDDARAAVVLRELSHEQRAAQVAGFSILATVRHARGAESDAVAMLEDAELLLKAGIESESARIWAQGELAAAWAVLGREERARVSADAIGDAVSRVRALSGIALQAVSARNEERARYWAGEALSVATGIEARYELSVALGEVALVYARLRDLDRGRDLLSQALELARGLESGSPAAAGALAKVARKLALLGDYEAAFLVTEGMLEGFDADRDWARAGLAHFHAARGEFDRALDGALDMKGEGLRLRTLAELLTEYTRHRGGRKAPDPVLERIVRGLNGKGGEAGGP